MNIKTILSLFTILILASCGNSDFQESNSEETKQLTNEKTEKNIVTSQVLGQDNKIYKTVIIGKQEWMAENLDVFTFRNGDSITEANMNNTALWNDDCGRNMKPAWCYIIYQYHSKFDNTKRGKAYNWFAVNDKRGLAPKGWHIPTNAEWETLLKFIKSNGGSGAPEIKDLKDWSSDDNKNNNTGFSALRLCDRYDSDKPEIDKACWWSATESSPSEAEYFHIHGNNNDLKNSLMRKHNGMAIRCIKD